MTPVVCPSGFTFTPRKLGGRLLAQLAAKSEIGSFGEIVQQCCASIEDPGPYALGKDGQVNWRRVVAGDLSVGFVRIRSISLPATYDGQVFKWSIKCPVVDCEDEHGKRTQYTWIVRLDEVPVLPLSEDARRRVRSGNVFDGTLLDGRAFTFKLPTDEDGAVIRKLLLDNGINRATLTEANVEEVLRPFMVAARVLSVAGCPDTKSAREEILDSDVMTIGDVTRQINGQDGGFDSFKGKCPNCGHEPDLSLPLSPQLLLSLSHAEKKSPAKEEPTSMGTPSPSSPVELGGSSKPVSPG